MKNSIDPRITIRHRQLKIYLASFIIILLLSASYSGIYYGMITIENNFIALLMLLTFTFIASGILVIIIGFFMQKFFYLPSAKVMDAAKKVAAGDFSVHIPPSRTDGKKDEFEVMFDDFNTMVSELKSVEMLKTDFVSNVSHEIKTPLAIIQNYSSMLMYEKIEDEERLDYATKINEATKRLTVLVTDILQLSRLENQKIAINRSKVNLSEQLCRCLLDFEQIWEEKKIEIQTDLDETIEVNSDLKLLSIVWNNLLSNAFKFTPEGKTVRISVYQENHKACVTIQDTGIGMTENEIQHIFDKFYQANASRASLGNGLGLSLVKQILTILDAEIHVESIPGFGSRFTVTIAL